MTYPGKLSYKNSPLTVTAVQQLLPGFQLCQTSKKKREGDVDKKVEMHAPVSLTPFSLSRYTSECPSLPKYLLPFPHSLALFSLSCYTSESPSHPFPRT
jgi:hypothetical protein